MTEWEAAQLQQSFSRKLKTGVLLTVTLHHSDTCWWIGGLHVKALRIIESSEQNFFTHSFNGSATSGCERTL